MTRDGAERPRSETNVVTGSRIGCNDVLAAALALPEVHDLDVVSSTQDVAHERAAEGAPAGTLILAREQSAGRGRHGHHWRSGAGQGIWLTLIERPRDAEAIDVLALRVGLALADALDPFAPAAIQLKWPNDLFVDDRKVGGVLIEARWREGHPDWVAIGVGLNLVAPVDEPRAGGLGSHDRDAILGRIVPAMRDAAARLGPLTAAELAGFAARDRARGRIAAQPVAGTVLGIDSSGALLVATGEGTRTVRTGSLLLAEDS